MNKLSIGTVQFGLDYGVASESGKVSFNEVQSILNEAKKNGIDTLDTAALYGDSESVLGKANIAEFNVITKLPETPNDVKNVTSYIEESFFNSLKKLKVSKVYALLFHRPEQLFSNAGDEIYRTLLKLKEKGFIDKIGASIYHPAELDKIYSKYNLDLIQTPFNIFDRRLIETGWLKKLNKNNVEIHVRSVFLQGLLLMPRKQRPAKFNYWNDLWEKWDVWLKENNLTALDASIRYVLSIPEISKIIIGVDSSSQLKEIISASKGRLPSVPLELFSNDVNLLNPSNWNNL